MSNIKELRLKMLFNELNLSDKILKALIDKKYKETTPIQQKLIPAIFEGRDILAGAQTGSGKTAGFALPILQNLTDNFEDKHIIKAVIIVPTKELATQVYESFCDYGKYLPLKIAKLSGGKNLTSQVRKLENGVDIVVATSGRLLEHINQKNISLLNVKYLVLDEADTILDMGFIKEVTQVLSHLPEDRQNIFISATLKGSVKRLADKVLKRVKLIEVDSLGTSADSVKQIIHPVEIEKKIELLSYIIGSRNYSHVLVFVRKKVEADEVEKELNLNGLKTAIIHGDKSAGARGRALKDFKEKKVRVLVATDIAARGIDIPSLGIVINYDIPHVTGDYIHRIGRTGRAGKEGLAITLLSPQEEIALRDVEQFMGKKIQREIIKGYEPIVEVVQKGARKSSKEKKKVDGAFGKKKAQKANKKKKKVTKRDAFKKW
jgi:ATP-dependent RNA helicase RhlE